MDQAKNEAKKWPKFLTYKRVKWGVILKFYPLPRPFFFTRTLEPPQTLSSLPCPLTTFSLLHLWLEAMAQWRDIKRDTKSRLSSHCATATPFFHTTQGMRATTSTTKTQTLLLLLKKPTPPTPPFHRSAKAESYGASPAANVPLRQRRMGPHASILDDFLGFRTSKLKIGGWKGEKRKNAYLKHLHLKRVSCTRHPSLAALMGMVNFPF